MNPQTQQELAVDYLKLIYKIFARRFKDFEVRISEVHAGWLSKRIRKLRNNKDEDDEGRMYYKK